MNEDISNAAGDATEGTERSAARRRRRGGAGVLRVHARPVVEGRAERVGIVVVAASERRSVTREPRPALAGNALFSRRDSLVVDGRLGRRIYLLVPAAQGVEGKVVPRRQRRHRGHGRHGPRVQARGAALAVRLARRRQEAGRAELAARQAGRRRRQHRRVARGDVGAEREGADVLDAQQEEGREEGVQRREAALEQTRVVLELAVRNHR